LSPMSIVARVQRFADAALPFSSDTNVVTLTIRKLFLRLSL
jgi:hypothetical protein